MIFQTIKSVVIAWLITFSINTCISQNRYNVAGKITSPTDKALEFVSICIFRNSRLVLGTISDSLGNYSLQIPEGEYTFKASLVGYKTYEKERNIQNDEQLLITLEEDPQQLGELEIIAQKKIIERKSDRLVFNVGNSLFSEGSNGFDILRNTPMLRIDDKIGISIRGSQGAVIYIDNRRVNLSNDELIAFLQSMPSDNISSIEVITNPPSNYDAEGSAGVINIIMKKNPKMGWQGRAELRYIQPTYAQYSTNVNLNYRDERLNIYGNIMYKFGNNFSYDTYNQEFSRTFYYERIDNLYKFKQPTARLGVDFFPSTKQTLGIIIDYTQKVQNGHSPNFTEYYRQVERDSIFRGLVSNEAERKTFSTNFNYALKLDTFGQSLNVDVDYINYDVPKQLSFSKFDVYLGNNEVFNRSILFANDSKRNIISYSSKIDYSLPIVNGNFDLGGRISKTQNNSAVSFSNFKNNTYTVDSEKSNNFEYEEYNQAIYGTYSKNLGNLSLKLGLRGEWTQASGVSDNRKLLELNYFKLFPTLFFQHDINDNFNYGINYSRRIQRPDYASLNPLRQYTNPYSYYVGNPFLQPSFSHNVEANISFENTYFLSAFYHLTRDFITQIPVQLQNSNSYILAQKNIDKQYDFGISASATFEWYKWWQSNNNIVFSLNGSQFLYNSEIISNKGRFLNLSSINSFIISSEKHIKAELSVNYSPAGSTQGLFVLGSQLIMNCMIKKDILNRQAAISLGVSDILNQSYITIKVDYGDQKSFGNGFYDNRGLILSFRYNFGKQTIETSRKRETGNTQEKSRIQ